MTRGGVASSPVAPLLLVVLSGILLGTAGTAVALVPIDPNPSTIGIVRLFLGALILAALAPVLGGRWSRFFDLVRHPRVWLMAITSAAYQPLFFIAIDTAGVALITLVIVGSSPIFAGLIGWLFLKERIRAVWVFATALAIIGLALLTGGTVDVSQSMGVVFALLAGLGVGIYVNAAKVELREGAHPVELPAMAYLIGSVFLIPLLWGQSLSWVVTPIGILLAVYLGVVTMALANFFQVLGIRQLAPATAATLLLADPLTATLLGVFVLRESLEPLSWLGVGLIIVALIGQGLGHLHESRVTTPVAGDKPAI